MRRFRDLVKAVEVPLYFVTAILATYLAGANVLRSATWPDEATWAPWSPGFVAILVAALYVPVYALYKALDAHYEAGERQEAESARTKATALRDLDLTCQQVVAEVGSACQQVDVNDVAASVWLSREDGTFDRESRFFLPYLRKSSGIVWRQGKGVAGMAWATNRDLRADLRPLRNRLADMGPAAFNRLPPEERHGMTAAEFESAERYTGICAIRLFSTDPARTLLGIFVIDYMGSDHFDCVAQASAGRRVAALLAGAEEVLTAASL